jgi:hypothetical protein
MKHFLALRLEIEMLVNEKGNVMAELSDEKWVWHLAVLYISHHLNDLDTKLQGQWELISDKF